MAKRQSWWLWAAAALAYVFLYLPLVIVVVYSFNDSKLNAEWVGFTLDWYHKLFNNREMLVAARNSMVIGVVSALAATFFGALAGIAGLDGRSGSVVLAHTCGLGGLKGTIAALEPATGFSFNTPCQERAR